MPRDHKKAKKQKKDRHDSDTSCESSGKNYQKKKSKRKHVSVSGKGYNDDSDIEYRRDRKKSHSRRSKSRKSKRYRDEKNRRSSYRDDSSSTDSKTNDRERDPNEVNFVLADALYNLLLAHPLLVDDIPLLFVRLARGSVIDISNMPDDAAQGLAKVFECLIPYGLSCDNTSWKWSTPTISKSGQNSELVLINVVRSMLDEIGISIDAIADQEIPFSDEGSIVVKRKSMNSVSKDKVVKMTKSILAAYKQENQGEGISRDLGSLCKAILNGSSISLHDLSNVKLRQSLITLFEFCELELTPMESSLGKEMMKSSVPLLGYSLPEIDRSTSAKMLNIAIDFCDSYVHNTMSQSELPSDPLLSHNATIDSSSDEEGPVLTVNVDSPDASEHNKLASRRTRKIDDSQVEPTHMSTGSTREEWMLLPGKSDFLSTLESGKPIRSRSFQAKSKAADNEAEAQLSIDPNIQNEINLIRQEQDIARGPSLMELHRMRKANEASAVTSKKINDWNWKRETDLDAGRRVDKDALRVVFEGGDADLNLKFKRSGV